jgi:hypothetical protein
MNLTNGEPWNGSFLKEAEPSKISSDQRILNEDMDIVIPDDTDQDTGTGSGGYKPSTDGGIHIPDDEFPIIYSWQEEDDDDSNTSSNQGRYDFSYELTGQSTILIANSTNQVQAEARQGSGEQIEESTEDADVEMGENTTSESTTFEEESYVEFDPYDNKPQVYRPAYLYNYNSPRTLRGIAGEPARIGLEVVQKIPAMIEKDLLARKGIRMEQKQLTMGEYKALKDPTIGRFRCKPSRLRLSYTIDPELEEQSKLVWTLPRR